jgi:hypothetical protein
MAGMIGSTLLHPVFLAMLMHDLVFAEPDVPGGPEQFQRATALVVLVAGYASAMLAGLRALHIRRPAPADDLGADHAGILDANFGGRLACPVATGARAVSLEQDTAWNQPDIPQILRRKERELAHWSG